MAQALVGNFVHKPASIVISTSTTVSGAVDCLGLVLLGIVMPASWTAATLSFTGDYGDGTFRPLYDEDGTQIVWSGAAVDRILLALSTTLVGGLKQIKVVASAGQAADRTLQLIFGVVNP